MPRRVARSKTGGGNSRRPPAAVANGPLSLGSSLSIRDVGACAARLDAMLAAGGCELQVSELASVDTAGLQLLLAAALAARRRGLTLKLLGANGVLAGAASDLGLADHLAAAAQILP